MMRSLLQDITRPAVTTLMTAIDETMNSNTIFFKVQGDALLTVSNYRDELSQFLRSSLLIEMMLELDQQRGWYNYTHWDEAADGNMVMYPPTGTPAKDHLELVCTPINKRQFADRLQWMLREAWSPYQTHKAENQSQEIIRDFFWELFTPKSWPFDTLGAYHYWSEHSWFFADVKPDFFSSRGYYNGLEASSSSAFTYFDGGESDTCTFFFEADVFYLLFTNGSP